MTVLVDNDKYRLSRNEKHPEILNFFNKETNQVGIIREPLKYAMATTIEELIVSKNKLLVQLKNTRDMIESIKNNEHKDNPTFCMGQLDILERVIKALEVRGVEG